MKRFLIAIVALLAVGSLAAQSHKVEGTVTDAADGSALIGVSVMLDNSTVGTTTDVNGNYVINLPTVAEGKSQTLTFSYMG